MVVPVTEVELVAVLSEGLVAVVVVVASIYACANSPAIEHNPPAHYWRAVLVVTQWSEFVGQQLSDFVAAMSAVHVGPT